MCPRHSVCVPCPCGLKKMLLKLVELPSETLPIQSPNFTGSISGFSIYHAIGFLSELVIGIEISMGFDKSIWKFWMFAIILTTKTTKIYTKFTKLCGLCAFFVSLVVNYSKFSKNKSLAIPSLKNFPFFVVRKTFSSTNNN